MNAQNDATYKTLIVEQEGPVTRLTLNRPERRNAIGGTMVQELYDFFQSKMSDFDTRVIVMGGAGKGFCSGLDLIAMGSGEDSLPSGPGAPSLTDIVLAMRAAPQPIVALGHGAACGAGMALLLGADIRIAGESLKMNVAPIKVGLSGCELGVSYFLPRLVGLSATRELMYTGAFIEAPRAYEIGLVSRVVPDADMMAAAQPIIDNMLATSPLGLRLTKKTLDATLGVSDLATVMEMELHAQSQCQANDDFQEAIKAFAEKRPPKFAGAS